MSDARSTRLRRLGLRSMRRGMREMDLILGPFGQEVVPTLSDAELDLYEKLLDENDQDLYRWIAARMASMPTRPDQTTAPPAAFCPLIDRIAAFVRAGGAMAKR